MAGQPARIATTATGTPFRRDEGAISGAVTAASGNRRRHETYGGARPDGARPGACSSGTRVLGKSHRNLCPRGVYTQIPMCAGR